MNSTTSIDQYCGATKKNTGDDCQSHASKEPGELIIEKIVQAYRSACTTTPMYTTEGVTDRIGVTTTAISQAVQKLKQLWSCHQALPYTVMESDTSEAAADFRKGYRGVLHVKDSKYASALNKLHRQVGTARHLLDLSEYECAYACATEAGDSVILILEQLARIEGIIGDLNTTFCRDDDGQ